MVGLRTAEDTATRDFYILLTLGTQLTIDHSTLVDKEPLTRLEPQLAHIVLTLAEVEQIFIRRALTRQVGDDKYIARTVAIELNRHLLLWRTESELHSSLIHTTRFYPITQWAYLDIGEWLALTSNTHLDRLAEILEFVKKSNVSL